MSNTLLALISDPPKTATIEGDLRTAPWQPPAMVAAELQAEAGQAITELTAEQQRQADRQHVGQWLSHLGVLIASGRMTVDDSRLKLAAYQALLPDHYGAAVFTATSLERAARTMKWFPSYAELTEFLDAEAERGRIRLWRLRKIAEAQAEAQVKQPVAEPMTEAERQAAVAEAKAALAGAVKRIEGDLADSRPERPGINPSVWAELEALRARNAGSEAA